MSKLVTEKRVSIKRSELNEFKNFADESNFTRHSNYVKSHNVDGVEITYAIEMKEGVPNITWTYKYKGSYYGLNEDNSIRFNVDASNLSELESETNRVNDALTVLKQIDVNDYVSEVEKSIKLYKMLDGIPYLYDLNKIFEYFGEDVLDKHEVAKELFKTKVNDLKDSVLTEFYWRGKNESISVFGKWFDSFDEKVKLMREFKTTYGI